MSTITTSGIDATKPATTSATTASVRDNFAEIITQLDNAKSDIVTLEAHPSATSTHGVTGSIVGTTDTQTLTNKTIVVASNTITTAASGALAATELNAALAELESEKAALTDLASTATGKGASLIGLEDSAGDFTATDVEGAFGEIFEQGSNANGEYIKFVSGWMICTHYLTLTYSNTVDMTGVWTFPSAFISTPKDLDATATIAWTPSVRSYAMRMRVYAYSSTSTSVAGSNPSSSNVSGDTCTVFVSAMGLWK